MFHTRWQPQQGEVTTGRPITSSSYNKVPSVDVTSDPPTFSLDTTFKNSFEEPGLLFFCTSRGLQDLSVDTTHGPPSLPFDIDINHLLVKNKKSMEGHYHTLPIV
jgi:hypothetical protein